MVAVTRTTDPARLSELARDSDVQVRRILADNPQLSDEDIQFLLADEDWGVRMCIARNPRLTRTQIMELVVDENDSVRAQAIACRMWSSQFLWKLSLDPSQKVQQAILNHPRVTPEIKAVIALAS